MTDVNNPSADDVKTEVTTETPETDQEDKFEVTPEQYAKLQELERNKSIALKKEREQYQEAQKKLAEYEKAEQERIEKEKKKQGKYEELLAEKEERLKSLEEKAAAYDKLQEEITQAKQAELDWLLEKMPTNLQEKYESITSKLELADKVAFYKNIMEDYKKEDFDAKPKSKWAEIDGKPKKPTSVLDAISNAKELD